MRTPFLILLLPLLAACPGPVKSQPDAGADGGSSPPDAGPSDSGAAVDGGGSDAGADGGIRYSPFACADAGFGSPFDRTEAFTAPNGAAVTITICGPRPGSATTTVSPVDGGSSAALLALAVAQAIDAGPGSLVLAPGVYDFAGVDGGAHWLVSGASDLIIDGQGSTLLFHELFTGLQVSGSQRLLLRNLNIDWGVPLAVSGSLAPANTHCDGGLAFVVDPAFPMDGGLPILALSEFDVATPGWPRVPFQQAHWSQIPAARPTYASGQTYCVGNPQALAALPSGTPVVGLARLNGSNALNVNRSSHIALENVTVYASPAEAIAFNGDGQGIRMSRCAVRRNPQDATRLIASNADGVNFRQTLGSVLLEDSEFADEGDDGISVVGQFYVLSPNSSPTSLSLTPANSASGIVAGDTVAVVTTDGFAPVGSGVVSQVTQVRDAGVLLGATVALAAPGIAALADGGAPGLWDGGLLASVPGRSSPNFLIRNVSLHDNDQRGILIHAANGLVDGCALAHNLGLILMAQDNFFLEGPGASNVTVQNTLFDHCDFMAPAVTAWSCQGGSVSAAPPAPLSVMSMTFDPTFPAAFPNATIDLMNNVINGAPGIGILISSATGVQVVGNSVLDANQTALTNSCGRLTPLPSGSMVALESATVSFSQNRRDGGSSLGLVVDPSCQGCSTQSGY